RVADLGHVAAQIVELLDRRHPEIGMKLELIVQPARAGLLHSHAKKIRTHFHKHLRSFSPGGRAADNFDSGTFDGSRSVGRTGGQAGQRRRPSPLDWRSGPYDRARPGSSREEAIASSAWLDPSYLP